MTVRAVTSMAIIVAAVTLTAATVVWVLWGPSAAFVLTRFVSAIAGLSKALIELGNKLEQILSQGKREKGKITPQGGRREWRWLSIPLTLLIGVSLGYFALPPSVRWALRPVVSISIAETVDVHPTLRLRWRNVPKGDQIWLLVYAPQDEVSFIQQCHTEGGSSGAVNCEVEVGGSAAGGREFEIRAVLANPAASRTMGELQHNPGYLRAYPSGAFPIESVRVQRQTTGQ